MSLALAEQSIQLLTCHISRWRLFHRSPQDNQSKSWKKVWPLFVFSLITPHALSTSRAEHKTSYMSSNQRKTMSSFNAREPIQILGKGMTFGVVVTGDGVYDTWEQFMAGVHRLGISSKAKKKLKLFLSVRPSTPLASFFLSKYSVSCLQTEIGCCPWWLPLAPAEQSIQLFICHSSRQFLQWKFIYIHIFRQLI